jgi:hypothetical protein
MSKVLPRTEHSNDIRIDLSLRVRKEYIVGSGPAPGDKFIQEIVRRNTPVMDALFGGMISHG